MSTSVWQFKPVTMTFRARPAKQHYQWTMEKKKDPQPLLKTEFTQAEAWEKMVELYDAYMKNPDVFAELKQHIIWHDFNIWYGMPENFHIHEKPIEFWILFRDAAEWGTVKRILRKLPVDYVHQYLIKQVGSYSYGEDFKVILDHLSSSDGMEREFVRRQYSTKKKTLTPDEALALLNAVEETNPAPDDSKRVIANKLRKRQEKIGEALTSSYWDGSLPDHASYSDFSDLTWALLLMDMHASTVERLLHVIPESAVAHHFNFRVNKDFFRAERDFTFVCAREDNKDVPQEWLKGMYLS